MVLAIAFPHFILSNKQECLATLFSLYIRDAGFEEGHADAGWLGRQGVALALHSAADVLRTKDLPVVMTFLISRALVSRDPFPNFPCPCMKYENALFSWLTWIDN